jgi:dTDP-4-amino-4,6-dideoxygalactose transaminase
MVKSISSDIELGKHPLVSGEERSFPFLDLTAQFATIQDEVMNAVTKVMQTQRFILGEEVELFEQEFASFIGSRFAVGCASGSDALLLALLALGVGSGDEVITTPFTFVATGGAVARVGATPVFVDIDSASFNLDANQVTSHVTDRTKAVIPVHLFGLAADMDAIAETSRKYGISVIEDAAQAIGAEYKNRRVGTLGTFGCFSFFPSKNLGAAGDGGIVTTNDPILADRLRLLRVHGSDRKYYYQIVGTNSRLDALQAAILRVKLKHLVSWTACRQRKAAVYRELFHEYNLHSLIHLPAVPDNRSHVYNQFVCRCQNRDGLREFLDRSSIPTEIYYPGPLHLQRAFAYLGYKPGAMPRAEAASNEVLALPIYPELTEEHQRSIVHAIASFYGRRRKE